MVGYRRVKKRRHGYMHNSAEMFELFRPQGRVLDLGCGEGKHTSYLTGKGFKVIALDISTEQLPNPSDINFVCADGMQLPFKNECFDSVFCFWVLEHLSYPERCVTEVHRVLKEAGTVCFSTPCLNIPVKKLIPVYRKLARIDRKRAEEKHLHVFSDKKLFDMLAPFFEINEVRYTDFATVLQHRLGIGYDLDRILSVMARRVPILSYLAASVLIKGIKRGKW